MGQRETLFRYLTMLQLIPRTPRVCATTTIAQKLEEQGFSVNLRSVQRDLEKLSAHFPLICNKGSKPYRWSFSAQYRSDLPALDAVTALTLVLAEKTVQGLLPKVVSDQIEHKFDTARRFLDGLPDNGYARWSQVVRAVPQGKALMPAPIAAEIWNTVTEALLSHCAIDVEYLSRSQGEVKRYTLHPLGLVARPSVTYLLASVNEHADVRQFAFHRIRAASTSAQLYRGRKNFNLQDYINEGALGFPLDPEPVTLVARVAPDIAWLLSETPLSENQSLSEPDTEGWVTLEADVPNDQQTLWWIMGYGANIHVLEPAVWREAIIDHARRILGQGRGLSGQSDDEQVETGEIG